MARFCALAAGESDGAEPVSLRWSWARGGAGHGGVQEVAALGRGSGLSQAVHFELADGDGEDWFDGDADGELIDWYDGKKENKGEELAAVPPFPTLAEVSVSDKSADELLGWGSKKEESKDEVLAAVPPFPTLAGVSDLSEEQLLDRVISKQEAQVKGLMAVASPSPSALTSPWRLGSAPPRRHIAGEAEEESGGLDGEGHGGAAVVECAEVPQQELAADLPLPSFSVRAQNAEVFIKTEQAAAARRLASDVATATVVTKGQVEPGELAGGHFSTKEEQIGDIRARRALAILADLLEAITDNGDDPEFVGKLAKEVTTWVKTCAKLGVDLGDLKEEFEGLDVVQYSASSGGGGPLFP